MKNVLPGSQGVYVFNYNLADVNGHYSYTSFAEDKDPKKVAAGSSGSLIPFLMSLIKKAFNEKLIKNAEARGKQDVYRDYVSIAPSGEREKGTLSLLHSKVYA